MPKTSIHDLPTEGTQGVSALCRAVRELGYKDPYHQMGNKDGYSCIGDLVEFLEDNPGAIESLYDWIGKNFPQTVLEEEDDDDEEEE